MLSYNFLLLKSAPLTRYEKKSLWLIFCSTYLDMYDLALYVGYSIYLSLILFKNTNLFEDYFLFSAILCLVQFGKLIGLLAFNYFTKSYARNIILAPIVIGAGYLYLAIMPSYHQIGIYSLYLFALVRFIQGIAFGFEFGFTINFANSHFQNNNKRFMYYFIIFSGELGALVSIFFNRFIISHGINIVMVDNIIRFQNFIGFAFILSNVSFRIRYGEVKKHYVSFAQKCFFYTLKKSGGLIILRAGTLCLNVTLLVMVIFRLPNFMHVYLSVGQHYINHVMLILSLVAFLGTNLAKILNRYYSAMKILVVLYFAVVLGCASIYFSRVNLHVFVLESIYWSFIYGMLIRLIPVVLYPVTDFNRHNRLTARYLGHTLAYTFWGSVTILTLDLTRFLKHQVFGAELEIIILVAALISALSIWAYLRQFRSI